MGDRTTGDGALLGTPGKGDIVRHGRHGVGVVLVTSQFCQVRFLGGKGPMDPRDLTVLLPASQAEQFLSETLREGKIESDLIRGTSLWLRSDDPRLRAVAVALISASSDPRLILIVAEVLAQFPPGVRSRVSDQLSAARVQRHLEPWPDTVMAIHGEREARRLRDEALLVAERAEAELARREAEIRAAVHSQVVIIAAIRLRLGRPALTEAEHLRIERAVRANVADPHAYRNVCWKCHTPVHSSFNPHCSACGWLVCICGGCRSPNFVDRYGRSGACPQEVDLLPR